ncbi:hypothetical protein A8F94_09805 [Bacillus sp. FJAT-27225]|uniref:RNA polymerase sigma factor n=1 Tax=Bacillus sp. FJAT-27225 TaxID=1743144 RepID=UPI00080C2C18|nr:sigma-70 family RNA polymerase sigma factor [Bacillus sp. FJAT-27225]OCA88104.1 hypothetical protein A8F94_09805 [Bacillus sp. FJAT-27225]
MPTETEHQLISTIYEHKHYFTRIARRFLRSDADVEDAVQEMIFKAFKSSRTLKEPNYMKTWLTRILINQCNDIIRKRPPIQSHALKEPGGDDANFHKTEIRQLFDMLNPGLRLIAILFYYEEMTQKEIAVLLNMPIGTVKSKLFDARAELRKMLGEGK